MIALTPTPADRRRAKANSASSQRRGETMTRAPLAAAAAGGDTRSDKAKAGACLVCHGANGQGSGSNPALAEDIQDELLQALKDYISGKPISATMKMMAAAELEDENMPDVAAYSAAQKKK